MEHDNDNHNKSKSYLDDLMQEILQKNDEVALFYRKQGYDVFYDVISPNLDLGFFFIAIKEGRKPVYIENPDIRGIGIVDVEHPEKIDKLIEDFFYSGLFPELLYKDHKHLFFNVKDKLSENNNTFCPVFTKEVYEDTKNVLSHISDNIHFDKNLYSIGEETENMIQVYQACLDNMPHKFRGEAGVGKTYDLCYAATKYAANHKDKRILIVTYTIALTNKIRHLLDSFPFKYSYNQIIVSHYHSIFKPRGNGDDKFCYKADQKNEFDLVLIDECQNLKNNYCLKNLLSLAKNNNAIYFSDIKQDCYGYNERDASNKNENEAATPVIGRWNKIKVKKTYRMNDMWGNIASLFAGEIINGNMMVSKSKYSVNYEKLKKDDYQACFDNVLNIIKTANDIARKNITVLFTGSINSFIACNDMINEAGYSTITAFEPKRNYGDRSMDDKPYKVAFNPYSKKIKVSTVKSFQGMEQDYIILIIRDEKAFLDNQVYTAITRARKDIFIIDMTSDDKYEKFFKRVGVSDFKNIW